MFQNHRMLTEQEIKELLNDIENERVERTISTTNTDKFAQAICAFANDITDRKLPGYLFIGTNDNGSLSGLKVTDELLRNLAGLRSDGNILPQPALMVYKYSFPEGDLAVVEVQPSKLTPVRYKGTIWIRVGARIACANEEEERILTERRLANNLTFDTCPCLDATLEDLDIDLFFNDYLPKAVDREVLKHDKRDVKCRLASLRLYDMGNDCPTYAGILLLGFNPKYYLFGAYIQYVKFAGQTRTTTVLKENEFSGNLISMLKNLDGFVKYSIENKRPVFVSALREEMVTNYPYEAVRELLMNAVMHRTYQSNAPVKFYEYADRIEIDNPGNLFGKARPENFPDENDYRNPVVAEAMKILGYVNRFSRGVNMVQESLIANQSKPAIFQLNDITTFKVTVYNRDMTSFFTNNVTNNVTKRQKKIIELIQQDKNISTTRMAEVCGVNKRTILRDIENLKEKYIRYVGDRKAGHWEVIVIP